jgi:hypothetical protein
MQQHCSGGIHVAMSLAEEMQRRKKSQPLIFQRLGARNLLFGFTA